MPQFLTEIEPSHRRAWGLSSPGLTDRSVSYAANGGDGTPQAPWRDVSHASAVGGFLALHAPSIPETTAHFQFDGGIAVEANAAVSLARSAIVTPS